MDLTPHTYHGPDNPEFLQDILDLRKELLKEEHIIQKPEMVPGDLSDAFALLDPDLAFLHKDMKTAAAHLKLAKKSGNMVDMALWRFNSAKSAYKTRLLEVRQNKMMEDYAQKVLQEDEEKVKRDMRNSAMQEEMNRAFSLRRERVKKQKEKKEKQQNWFFYFMLGMWLSRIVLPKRDFNQLSQAPNLHSFFNDRTKAA